MLYFLLVFNKFHKLIVIIFLKSWTYCIFFDPQPILYSDSTSNRDVIYGFGLLPFRFSWRFDLFYCFGFLADSVSLVFSVSFTAPIFLSLQSLLSFRSLLLFQSLLSLSPFVASVFCCFTVGGYFGYFSANCFSVLLILDGAYFCAANFAKIFRDSKCCVFGVKKKIKTTFF